MVSMIIQKRDTSLLYFFRGMHFIQVTVETNVKANGRAKQKSYPRRT
jgi:hypothetical protein